MATSTIKQQISEIKAVTQAAAIPSNERYITVTANVPSGYKFLCWTQVTSNGWVGHVYPASPTDATSDMWTSETASTTARGIRCGYLCYK